LPNLTQRLKLLPHSNRQQLHYLKLDLKDHLKEPQEDQILQRMMKKRSPILKKRRRKRKRNPSLLRLEKLTRKSLVVQE